MAEAKWLGMVDEQHEEDETSSDPEESMVASRTVRAPQLPRLGRYRLVREIATGGMATVNLAVTEGLDKLVALKMIHPHLAQEEAFVRMFLDEARIASSISHRNVCNTFDFGEAEGRYFIAMDFLAGHCLKDLVLRLRKTPAEAEPVRLAAFMAYIIAEACEGLHAAHELRDAQGELLNVVHRDVSPHNLFITYEGNVSVVDFGIARASDRLQHTATGVLKGKFSYMAPEQVRQQVVDRRADIWSLGVCLWESVTLQRLFVRSSQADTLMSVMMDRVRPPSEVRPELPKGLDAVIQKALARSPKERYATAREMGRDLMQVVRDTGVLVGPVEIEQWLERLFPTEREEMRALVRHAKQAALDSSWAEGTAPEFQRLAGRSGLVPKVGGTSPSVSRCDIVPSHAVPPAEELSAHGASLEHLLAQPASRPKLSRTQLSLIAACMGMGATALLMWSTRGEEALVTQPVTAAVVEPLAPVDPKPVVVEQKVGALAAPSAEQQERLSPEMIAAEPSTEVQETKEPPDKLESPTRNRREGSGRAFHSPATTKQDVSRSAPTEPSSSASIPETRATDAAENHPAAPPVIAVAPAANAPAQVASAEVGAPREAPSMEEQPKVQPEAKPKAEATPPAEVAPSPKTPQKVEPFVVRADFADLDVEGSLGTGVVARMLSRATPLLPRCYSEAAKRSGKNDLSPVTFSLTIDEMGAVRGLSSASHPLSGLSSCVADAINRLRSDRKPDIGVVKVRGKVTFEKK